MKRNEISKQTLILVIRKETVFLIVMVAAPYWFKPSSIFFTDRSKAVLLLWIFYAFFCLVFVMPLCASVYMCFVVTCWERADLLALVCGV